MMIITLCLKKSKIYYYYYLVFNYTFLHKK